jgi:hypothetical protein
MNLKNIHFKACWLLIVSFILEGVAEVSQIFLRDTHVLPKLASYEEQCKPITALLQSM